MRPSLRANENDAPADRDEHSSFSKTDGGKLPGEVNGQLMLEKVHSKLREKLMLDKVPGEVREKLMLNKYLGKCAVN